MLLVIYTDSSRCVSRATVAVAGSALKGRAAADNDADVEDLAAARDRAVRDCRSCEIDSILFMCNR
eukprot:scaffold523_cov148-Skeletonema_menzelii.AAC.6